MHQKVPAFGADQAADRGLPLLKVLLRLRQFMTELAAFLQRDGVRAATGGCRMVGSNPD